MRSFFGCFSTSSGVPCSWIVPSARKITRVGDVVGEAELVRDQQHGAALLGERADHAQHLADQLGIERRGRLVEQQQLGIHGQRAGDGDALLLAAREVRRIGLGLVGEADPRQLLLGARARLGLGAGGAPCAALP